MKPAAYFTAILAFGLCFQTGCIHKQVRLDLDTYNLNPQAYEGQDIIITASLADVLARYDQYLKKTIEITAPVSSYSSYGFWTWHMLLEEKGSKLRCYTHYYRVEPGWDAINLLERAMRQKAPVTALGVLRKDGLDLERLESDGTSAITSYKPPRPGSFFWPYH